MKNKLLIIASTIALSLVLVSCSSKRVAYDYDDYYGYRTAPYGQTLPPGQAKKIYGDKNARRYAPGQQKKQYRNHRYYRKKRDGRRVIIYDRYGNRVYTQTSYPRGSVIIVQKR